MAVATTLGLLLLVICWCSCGVARAAPPDTNRREGVSKQSPELEEQTEEQQLESLKSLPGNVAVVKSNSESFVQLNGKTQTREMHEEHVEDVDSGKTVAKVAKEIITSSNGAHGKPKTVVKTEVDIPSQGIHKITMDKKARSRNQDGDAETDLFSPYDSIHYTPTDMAEYIRKTGDDEGVAMAIEELVNEGLMSRNEAAIYLDEVKNELESMQQVGKLVGLRPSSTLNGGLNSIVREERRPGLNPASIAQNFHTTKGQQQQQQQQQQHSSNMDAGSKSSFMNSKRERSKFSHEPTRFRNNNDNEELVAAEDVDNESSLSRNNRILDMDDEVDYNDLLERLRIADFLYKEYSLEEVIYQLAKEMFVQSIVKGNRDAEESLQRFSNFLQAETAEGRISKELEKKILDVVMAALMDAVGDQERQDFKVTSLKSSVMTSHPRFEHNKSKYAEKHKSLEAKNKSRELKQLVVKKSSKSVGEESRPKEYSTSFAGSDGNGKPEQSKNGDQAATVKV